MKRLFVWFDLEHINYQVEYEGSACAWAIGKGALGVCSFGVHSLNPTKRGAMCDSRTVVGLCHLNCTHSDTMKRIEDMPSY